MAALTHVLYDDIIVDPEDFPNARCDFKDLEGLSKNIEARGLLVSITLWRTADGRHVLADGIRRYAAIELIRERNPSRWEDLFGDGLPAKLLLCGKEDAVDISVLLKQYCEWLREERQLQYSSIANYMNSACDTIEFVVAKMGGDPASVDCAINLRTQADKQVPLPSAPV